MYAILIHSCCLIIPILTIVANLEERQRLLAADIPQMLSHHPNPYHNIQYQQGRKEGRLIVGLLNVCYSYPQLLSYHPNPHHCGQS